MNCHYNAMYTRNERGILVDFSNWPYLPKETQFSLMQALPKVCIPQLICYQVSKPYQMNYKQLFQRSQPEIISHIKIIRQEESNEEGYLEELEGHLGRNQPSWTMIHHWLEPHSLWSNGSNCSFWTYIRGWGINGTSEKFWERSESGTSRPWSNWFSYDYSLWFFGIHLQ